MNRKVLVIAAVLVVLAAVTVPAMATLPPKSPLPTASPWSSVWSLFQDLQKQINDLKTSIAAIPTDKVVVLKGAVTSFDNPLPGAIKTVDVPAGFTHDQCVGMVISDSPTISILKTPFTLSTTKDVAYREDDGKFHPYNIVSVTYPDGGGESISSGAEYCIICQKP